MEWQLAAELTGHSSDVRAVGAAPESAALSGSRDHTARLWAPAGPGAAYAPAQVYGGPASFVGAVAFLAPSATLARGLVLVGAHDGVTRAYELDSPNCVREYRGHGGAVCCLAPAARPGCFLSASWDSTAAGWNCDSDAPLYTLRGHQAVVWGVLQLGDGHVATASADKTIALWNGENKQIKTLTGHTDCVRALAIATPDTFLSCANDASIRLWSNTGSCIKTFFGHSNYIYSICSNPLSDVPLFVSCGEDSTIRVWTDGINTSTITLPAQSVWSVACLSNGDIVSGSSDGTVRIFTRDPSRRADEATTKNFQEEVNKHVLSTNQEIGGIKITDLPGPETLFQPGKSDGQTKLIRAGDKVKCYSWSTSAQCWSEIGEVTGSAKPTEGKHMYLGKEYDYVFNVDIDEGKPPIKLPYNVQEDPWVAAQTFIHKNDLPQAYLEQVANFIITNSKRDHVQTTSDSGYVDPFTGSSRHVPGSGSGASRTAGSNADPFTGSSSYTTSKNTDSSAGATNSSTYFPHKTYLRFEQANVAVIRDKINEFNNKVSGDYKMSDEDLLEVINLADQKSVYDADVVDKLKKMLDWPQEILFPVLDILRLAIRNVKVSADIFDKNIYGPFLLDKLLKNLYPDAHLPNQLLTLRILTNAFIHLDGEMFVLKEHENILSALISLQTLNKNMQIAAASLLLNMCVALGQQTNTTFLCQCLLEISLKFEDNEACFRGLVALGTLVQEAPVKTSVTGVVVSHDTFMNKLRFHTNSNEQKNSKCAKDILALMQ